MTTQTLSFVGTPGRDTPVAETVQVNGVHMNPPPCRSTEGSEWTQNSTNQNQADRLPSDDASWARMPESTVDSFSWEDTTKPTAQIRVNIAQSFLNLSSVTSLRCPC